MEFIMSIVFDNEKCFVYLSKIHCRHIIKTFHYDMYSVNSNIIKWCNKYAAEYYYEILLENMVSKLLATQDIYIEEEHKILYEISLKNQEIQENFKLLLITEFKERLFTYSENDRGLLTEHKRIVNLLGYKNNEIRMHKHNPCHFMWHNMNIQYKFYEMFEKLYMHLEFEDEDDE